MMFHKPMPLDEFKKLSEAEQLAYISYLGRRIWVRRVSFYLILASLGVSVGSLFGNIFLHRTVPIVLMYVFLCLYIPGLLIGLFVSPLARLKWIPEDNDL